MGWPLRKETQGGRCAMGEELGGGGRHKDLGCLVFRYSVPRPMKERVVCGRLARWEPLL